MIARIALGPAGLARRVGMVKKTAMERTAAKAAQANTMLGVRVAPPPGAAKREVTVEKPADDPFLDLGLDWKVLEEAGAIRVRQHVNPLQKQHQIPATGLEWDKVFADPKLPLVVDVGCGPGRFLLLLAKRWGTEGRKCNYLGIEIRTKMAERANKWAKLLGLDGNVHFLATNATISMKSLLEKYPGDLDLVCVQFPDPHFKRKHHKRRTVQPQFVDEVTERLAPGGRVFLQSDVEAVAIDMRDQFEERHAEKFELDKAHAEGRTFPARQARFYEVLHDRMTEGGKKAVSGAEVIVEGAKHDELELDGQWDGDDGGSFRSKWAQAGWLVDNPLPAPTEREVYELVNEKFGGVAHRILLVKKDAGDGK
ncbi:unnamed protein product [Pedinophyceae sp. YPF-701]|nr:unnamed protein product [Pedinophyceae sp. YPF-701]